jgi:nitrogen fixation protein FixH
MPQDLLAARPDPRPRRERKLTGTHVLTMFIAFFAVVGAVNAYMMRAAFSTMPGLDARNGYDVSQRYNTLIAEAEAQARAGWRADARLEPTQDGMGIKLALAGPGADGSRPLDVSVRFDHPAARARDVVVTLRPAATGGYEGAGPALTPGLWGVTITAADPATGETVFRSRHRTTIKGA